MRRTWRTTPSRLSSVAKATAATLTVVSGVKPAARSLRTCAPARELPRSCYRLLVQTSLKPYERALYGLLSSETDAVLPVCETWEDHLWAYLQALLANEFDRRLAESEDGQFWLQGQREAERKNTVDLKQALGDAFERLQESSNRGVRIAASHPLRIAQRFLMLGETDRLFDEFAANLEARAADLPEECVP